MAIDPNGKIRVQPQLETASKPGAGPQAIQDSASSGTGPVLKTAYAPIDALSLRGRVQDRRVSDQLDGLLCRLEAHSRGLKPLAGFSSPDQWMKGLGFPERPDVSWLQGKFDEANEFVKANPGHTGTFVDFDAVWTIDREKNTLTVTLPKGLDDAAVVSFPLESVVRYLEKAR